VKIERDVEPPASKPLRHCEVVAEARDARPLRNDEELVDVRVARDHRRGRRLNDVRDVRIRESAAKRAEDRRGERDVAYQAKPNKEDPRGVRLRSWPRQ
jgi:hypothetical protein